MKRTYTIYIQQYPSISGWGGYDEWTLEDLDSEGAAGFRDQVDNHWGRIFSGALLTSLFAAGIQISQGQNSSVLTQPSYGQQKEK